MFTTFHVMANINLYLASAVSPERSLLLFASCTHLHRPVLAFPHARTLHVSLSYPVPLAPGRHMREWESACALSKFFQNFSVHPLLENIFLANRLHSSILSPLPALKS